MTTLKEFARTYETKKTRNVSELPALSTDLDLKDDEFVNDKGEVIHYKYVELNGEKFRIPISVISDIKQIVQTKPGLNKVKVSKSGSGLSTKYTVIPLD